MPKHFGFRWGISVPQHFPDGTVDLALIRNFVKQAEEIGFDSLWVQERGVAEFPVLEPTNLLSFCAGITSRIKLGSSIIVAPFRNPPQLAKSLATIDQMSEGRLIIGLGLGNVKHYPAFQIPTGTRGLQLEECVTIMKALWTQPVVTFSGEFCQVNNFTLEPKPLQKPHPPLWFGASHPSALRRAVRLGDGWMGAGSSSTDDFERTAQLVRTYLEEESRDPSTFAISKRVLVAVNNDRGKAEQWLKQFTEMIYGQPDKGPTVGVYGSPQDCAEGLKRVLSMDPDLVLLTPVHDHMKQMELLASAVLPQLK